MTQARYHLQPAKTLLRGGSGVDPWFLGRYGMNLYRGCEHGCVYCDGRAERYYVAGDFERDVVVKENAMDLLTREFARCKEPGFVLLGGGVCDAYQPAERRFGLARGALGRVLDAGLPVHILTKSRLVERDFEILDAIHQQATVVLSMSIQTLDEDVRRKFEPRATPIRRRLETLRRAKARGYWVGMMALPVLPGISDQPHAIDELTRAAVDVGADFMPGSALTLRPGNQQRTYLTVIERDYPALLPGYRAAYRAQRPSGIPAARYLTRVAARFREAQERHGIPGRAPHALFAGRMPEYAEVGVLLEHLAFERGERWTDRPSLGLEAAGWEIQNWARKLVSRVHRKPGFTYRQVEGSFRSLCTSGDLVRVLPISEQVADEIIRLLAQVRAARRQAAAANRAWR